MNKFLAISCLVLVVVCLSLIKVVQGLHEEKDRLTINNESLMESVNLYKSNSGKYAASVISLTLTKSELEKNRDELAETIKDLNIKIKRLQSASSTSTNTQVKVQTIIKDSIVYRNGLQDTLQSFSWEDSWTKIHGEIKSKDVNMYINSVDTLKQIVHRVPKKFLFFRFGTKAIRQEIISSNPHTKIVYSEYIELKK